jgi:hypothetical protein
MLTAVTQAVMVRTIVLLKLTVPLFVVMVHGLVVHTEYTVSAGLILVIKISPYRAAALAVAQLQMLHGLSGHTISRVHHRAL